MQRSLIVIAYFFQCHVIFLQLTLADGTVLLTAEKIKLIKGDCPRKFLNGIFTGVFTTEELTTCSLTGNICNLFKDKSSKPGLPNDRLIAVKGKNIIILQLLLFWHTKMVSSSWSVNMPKSKIFQEFKSLVL